MSRRLLALTLAASFAAGGHLFAEGNLLESASRAVQALEQEQGLTKSPSARSSVAGAPLAARFDPARRAAQQGEGMATLSKSDKGKMSKALIYLSIGVGFAASAVAIDRHVSDVTPSHLGTRQDGCKVPVFGCN